MSYRGGPPTSPQSYEVDAMSPASPQFYKVDAMSPASQRTPKRRRIGSGESMEPFHQSPSRYSPPNDSFDSGAFSPIQSRDLPSSLQLNTAGDPFLMAHWEDMEYLWNPQQTPNMAPQNQQMAQTSIDSSTVQSHPQVTGYYQTAPGYMQQRLAREHSDAYWNMPPVPRPMTYRPMPPAPYHPTDGHCSSTPAQAPRSHNPSLWAPPQLPEPPRLPEFHTIPRASHPTTSRPRPAPAPPAPRKGGISLCLSRADATRIQELPEHKRECPACQLEFESDDYLAVISCCGTAMHAVCMSAWVNSQLYAKSRVCMKCRKSIDARRSLNNIVPPATDKSWDRGQDFTAPESVLLSTKIEFEISSRPESAGRRHYRREMASLMYRQRGTSSVAIIPETDVPARSRSAYRELLQAQSKEMDDLEPRYHTSRLQWQAAFQVEADSASAVSIAKDRYQSGYSQTANPSMSVYDVNALSEAVKSARKIQEQSHAHFRAMSREFDEVKKRHQTDQFKFLERVTREMATSEGREPNC